MGYTKDINNKLHEHIDYYNEKLESEDLNIEDKILINYSFLNILKIKDTKSRVLSKQSNDAQYAMKI